MKMRLPILPRVSDPLLKNILCLLYKLSMQIDRIIGDSSRRIILAENVIGRLFVVLVHFCSVCFSLLG